MTDQHQLKAQAAEAAMAYVKDDIIGVGTGSTVAYFIQALAKIKQRIDGAVASSKATENLLKQAGIPVISLNSINNLPLYVDGADEFNAHKYLIKGGGGALTREKIIASAAEKFVCIVDNSKKVDVLGKFPIPVEVIPMARSLVARRIVDMGGHPFYREGVITDNGNIILDIHGIQVLDPVKLEGQLKSMTGVVECGIFAKDKADVILAASEQGIETLS